MGRLRRDAPLPSEMQGRWIGADDPSSELVIRGGEISCYGHLVEYDFKDVVEKAGAIVVDLGVDDPANEDSFQRTNITGLVITPEREFLVYNVKFGDSFVRAGA